MKKTTYLFLLFLCGIFTNLSAQTTSETLVSNEWQLQQLVINGNNIPVPSTVNVIDIITGDTILLMPNVVKLSFIQENDSVYKLNSTMPYANTSGFYNVTNTSISISNFGPATSSSNSSDDFNYENFKSVFTNSYVGLYGGGAYIITGSQLKLGNETTYGIFGISDPCNSLNSPFGSLTQNLNSGQMLSDLVVTSGAGYELIWYADPELTIELPANTIAEETTYYVVQSLQGCTSIALPVAVTITPTAGLNNEQLVNLNIYPNPSTDVINVSYPTSIENIEMFDLTGRKIFSKSVSEKEIQLNISHLNSGIYILNIKTDEGIGSKKFIKK